MRKFLIVLATFLASVCLVYIIVFKFFLFAPGSYILDNNLGKIDISFKTNVQIAELIEDMYKGLKINITTISGEVFTYDGLYDIDKSQLEFEVSQVKKSLVGSEYCINMLSSMGNEDVTINRDKLDKIVDDINGDINSEDARIEYSENIGKYVIVPEIIGNKLKSNTESVLLDKLKSFELDINLVSEDLYIKPIVYSDSEELLKEFEEYEKLNNFRITYNFGNNQEIISFKDIKNWNNVDEAIEEYIDSLAELYDTVGKVRSFKTHAGNVIEITSGDYGWVLDKKKMIDDIKKYVDNLESVELKPIYKQSAQVIGDRDYDGLNYVEVSIDEQKLWMYVDGKCIVETPVVTGNISWNMPTRKGFFCLTYKTKNAILRGGGTPCFVYYWMPFDGGIGLHDATWRGKFGGEIYKKNGSHGCVNMPLEAAKTVYENLNKDMPIIVY